MPAALIVFAPDASTVPVQRPRALYDEGGAPVAAAASDEPEASDGPAQPPPVDAAMPLEIPSPVPSDELQAPVPAPLEPAPAIEDMGSAAEPPPPVIAPPTADPRSRFAAPDVVRAKAKRWRMRGGLVTAIGPVGLGMAVGLQALRQVRMRRCIRDLDNAEGLDAIGASLGCTIRSTVGGVYPAYLSALGLATFVAASGGGSAMLGYADAAEDAEIAGRLQRVRGRKIAGVVLVSLGAMAATVSTVVLLPMQLSCDLACGVDRQLERFIATDVSMIATAAGAGLLGHAVAYEKQGRALLRLRALPTAHRDGGQLMLAGRF